MHPPPSSYARIRMLLCADRQQRAAAYGVLRMQLSASLDAVVSDPPVRQQKEEFVRAEEMAVGLMCYPDKT